MFAQFFLRCFFLAKPHPLLSSAHAKQPGDMQGTVDAGSDTGVAAQAKACNGAVMVADFKGQQRVRAVSLFWPRLDAAHVALIGLGGAQAHGQQVIAVWVQTEAAGCGPVLGKFAQGRQCGLQNGLALLAGLPRQNLSVGRACEEQLIPRAKHDATDHVIVGMPYKHCLFGLHICKAEQKRLLPATCLACQSPARGMHRVEKNSRRDSAMVVVCILQASSEPLEYPPASKRNRVHFFCAWKPSCTQSTRAPCKTSSLYTAPSSRPINNMVGCPQAMLNTAESNLWVALVSTSGSYDQTLTMASRSHEATSEP
eukprot:m.219744 g.219744  ORF g.219744 m.219744 type:complete len:312 (-) comp22266_c0_seq34:265-1200(-)